MVLSDQDPSVVHCFTSESTLPECLVHGIVFEDGGASVDAGDLVDVSADHGVASTWEGGQRNGVSEETLAIEEAFFLWNLIDGDAFFEHVLGVLVKVPLLEAFKRGHRLGLCLRVALGRSILHLLHDCAHGLLWCTLTLG